MKEAGGKRRGLSEVAPESNDAQTRIGQLQSLENREAFVRAAIVDEDDFVAPSPSTEGVGQLSIQHLEIRLLVVNRDDDAYVHTKCMWFFVLGSAFWVGFGVLDSRVLRSWFCVRD